jgi:hypothetical protein
VEADLGSPEDARRGLLAADLADDRALAVGGRGHAERDRDRRLPDPALSGHEDQSFVEEFRHGEGLFQPREGNRPFPTK